MQKINFPTKEKAVNDRIKSIDPEKYASTKNYEDGALTYLSPYISRGFLTTRKLLNYLITLDIPFDKTYKLIQELAWRDYFQQVWKVKGNQIFSDLKKPQEHVSNKGVPLAVLKAQTSINAVDQAINGLHTCGYMHNHMRMYVASICCNVAQYHWFEPSKWMYSQLLDGDLASNSLSWQWISGTFSNKKYYANQENINKFFNSAQKETFLDLNYEQLINMDVPEVMSSCTTQYGENSLPASSKKDLIKNKITLIYNYYNLDPHWYAEKDVQRVLLLEPSLFRRFPVSKKCISFLLDLSKNIKGMILKVCEFDEICDQVETDKIIFKEHPLNEHYKGKEEPREWMFKTQGYFPSFSAFWKKCKVELEAYRK